MVATLIRKFHQARQELHNCIENSESPLFARLDEKIDAIFEAILSYKPRNLVEYRETLLFLIDTISRNDDGNNSRLILRLEDLVNRVIAEFYDAGTDQQFPIVS